MITRPGLMDLFHPVDFFLPIWLFLPSFLPQTHRSRRSFQILSDYCFTALASRAATRGVKDGPMRFIRRLKLGERGALERELFSCVETRREREKDFPSILFLFLLQNRSTECVSPNGVGVAQRGAELLLSRTIPT